MSVARGSVRLFRDEEDVAPTLTFGQSEQQHGRNHALHTRNIERVIRCMTSRLDLPMTNDEMADIACFSPCHFNRVFHKITGIPPMQFQYALRLERAKHLLISTDRSITDTCFDVGYNSLGTFITRFKELVGLSPNAFRGLVRSFGTTRLFELQAGLHNVANASRGRATIQGWIDEPSQFDGLIFVALFQRAIPEGLPTACMVRRGAGSFSLPIPGDGGWHIMSVAIPWSATGVELFLLDGLWRGRSGPIVVKDGGWIGRSTITMAAPSLLDPPTLASIPVFISRILAAGGGAASARSAASVWA
jgi:AraC family transcriptional regulator